MNLTTVFKRWTRTRVITVLTVLAIIVLMALNILLTYVGLEGQLFIDTTPEGFHSFSKNMHTSLDEILSERPGEAGNKEEIGIIFCDDPDNLTSSYVTRATYFMALQMRNNYEGINVKTVNVKVNPSMVAEFRTTSQRDITTTDMIVTYQGRYKIVDISSFWTSNGFSYNGEYRMVSILASLTALNAPVAYFTTDHGESYYDPADPDSEMSREYATFAELLEERGLNVKTLKLSEVDRIPEDCALLIINNPTVDFVADPDQFGSFSYVSDTEKIDRYLTMKSGSIMVNKDYMVDLPNFEDYLKEWGIAFGDGMVKDGDNTVEGIGEDGSVISGVYGPKDSIGAGYYEEYANLATSPKMVFSNTGYIYRDGYDDYVTESGGYNSERVYAEFISTGKSSLVYETLGSTVLMGAQAERDLAAMSVRETIDANTDEKIYSYIFATASTDFYTNDMLANKSYANYNIMASVVSNISRADRYASMSLGGLSLNSPSYGGKQTWDTDLPATTTNVYSSDAENIISVNHAFVGVHKVVYTIVVSIAPVAVLVLGVLVFVKRKHM